MKKQRLIDRWKQGLSDFQQNQFHSMNLDSIESFEIESGFAVIKVGSNIFECSLEALAKETGRTLKYILIEFRNFSDEEIKDMLEISFFNQNNIDYFFTQLTDAVISMQRIALIEEGALEWMEELQAKYTKIWQISPLCQRSPMPSSKDEFPNLKGYNLSFMAVGE